MKYFTDEDAKKLALLPHDEQSVFYRRFAEIQMRMKIADDVWEKSRDDIGKELDKLVEEIHTRLDMIYSFTDGTISCTVEYHPNMKDFEDAYAETNPKVQDRQRPAAISETGKEGKGEKR